MTSTRSSLFEWAFLIAVICQVMYVHGQSCRHNIFAGSGTITSPNYPNWYSPSEWCEWVIRSPENTRIRIRFIMFDLEESNECAGDSVSVHDGDATSDSPLLGRFCGSDRPPMMDSSGGTMTIMFMSDIQNEAQGFVLSYEIIDDVIGSRIVWTSVNPSTGETRLSSLPADPMMMLTPDGNLLPTITTQYYYSLPLGNWRAVTTDYGRQQVIWSDPAQKRILKGNIGPTARAKSFFGGTSSSVNGIAVDWLTGNTYWTDATYNWILMYNSNGTRFLIIVDDHLDNPVGIATHPSRGLLFWTDSGAKPKIERSNLAGDNRIAIATADLVRPNGITVDYTSNLVFWVDADPMGNRVEVCDITGASRRQLYAINKDAGFFDLTIFDSFIYVTGRTNNSLHLLRKDTGQEGFTLTLPLQPFGIMTYAPDVQPPAISHCSSNPCSYLCVGGGPNGYTCLCGNGQLLGADRHTCKKEGALNPPQLLIASRTKLCQYPSNFPDMLIPENVNVSCFLKNRRHAVAIAVDLEDGIVFYSDVFQKIIGMATLRDGSTVQYITGATASVEGMAVDWLTKNLYWTDNPRGEIVVSKYDGSYRTTLIHDNVLRPRSIVIDPGEKLMFWTEFGPPPQIERASLDGTRRVVIVSSTSVSPFYRPSGLVIDYKKKRLYYADIGTGTINSVDYNGGNKTQILTKVGAVFFELALYKDYILWTELGSNNGIFVTNRETGQPVRAYLSSGDQLYGIKMYANTRQSIVHNPCRFNNGGCDQLCLNSLANERGYVCQCTFGYHLADNGRSCLSDLVQDDFFLVTDTYRRGIFQVDMSANFEPEALQLDNIANPIGVTFDPVERKVYWSDVASHVIGRAMLDGSQQELVVTEDVGQPDGIAVDSISRLLYWTDMGTHTISVAKLDGSDRKTLITGLSNPRAVALHPVEGIMFWSDWRADAIIERSFMDGNMRRVIVSGALIWPNGLTVDYGDGRLYWCDGNLEKIESSDLLGHDRRVLIDFGTNVHTFGIAIVDQYVYWTDWAVKSVLRANKLTGRGNVTVGPNDYTRPNALFAVTNSSLPSGSNACSVNNGGCFSLCLPTATGRTCACADGIDLAPDEITCALEIQVECPRDFPYGGVSELCDLQPGSNCSVACYSGFVPAADIITCEDTGNWNVDSICREQQCEELDLPDHAVAGPCYPPYVQGKLCIHECVPGYIKESGDRRRICGHDGEWLGSPIFCREFVIPPSEAPGTCDTDLEFTEAPQDTSPAQGDLVQQHCRVNNPQVDITWYKDDVRLITGTVSGIYILPTNDLLIPGFESHHEGHYACVASFAGHECLRSEADYTFDPLRYFSNVPANASLQEGDHYVFECQARSALDVITWRKDDSPIAQTEQVLLLAGGSLLIRNLVALDAGKYTCVVSNQRRSTIKGEVDAWLTLSQPMATERINITEVCGTVTAPEAIDVTTPSPLSPRVVGGQQATRGSAPYMGRLWHKEQRSFICGATLINQRWVLTAAHCITLYNLQSDNILLYFGDHDSLITEVSQVVLEADDIIQHDNFNQETFDRDIALIRLKQPLAEFTDYIRPICIPPISLARDLLQTHTMGRVTGWGQIAEGGPYPRYLTEVDLPVVKTKRCKEATQYDVTKNMFCAGYVRIERDACQGDSGGPFAVRHDDGRWYQLGIVSWGDGCAKEGQYGYYTKLFRFFTWMNRHISD